MKKTIIICSLVFLSGVLIFFGIKELSFKGNRQVLFFSAEELDSYFAGDTDENEKLTDLFYIRDKGIRLPPDKLIPMLKNKGIPKSIKKELPSLMKKAGQSKEEKLEVRILSGEPGIMKDLPENKQWELSEFILSDFSSPVSIVYYEALCTMSSFIYLKGSEEDTEKFIEYSSLALKDIEKNPNEFIEPGTIFNCLTNTGKEEVFIYFMRLDSKEAQHYRGIFLTRGNYIDFVYGYMEENKNTDIIEKAALALPYDREFQERYNLYKNNLKEE